MNSSLVVDYPEFPPFSRRDLYILIGGGIVSAAIGLLLITPLRPTYNSAPLLNSVDIVSRTFATGLFSFLTAGLLFSSNESRQYILGKLGKGRERRAFLTRVLHVVLITGLFASVVTLIAFVKPIILGESSQYTISFSHLAYFPSVLASSLIVSTFLAVLASSLAVVTDESRLCVALGCVSTLVIANVAGWTPDVIYSLNRNIALLSPHNLVRGLAVQLSGYQFESLGRMARYLGFVVTIENLAVSIFILSLISMVLLVVGHRALSKSSTRWTILIGMIPREELWSSVTSSGEVQKATRRGLRIQRALSVVIVVLLLVSVNVGGSLNTAHFANSPTITHYESPENGEVIHLGVWRMIDVDVQPPFPGLFTALRFYHGILDWGNASEPLTLYYGILEMNSTEFASLDESNQLELVNSRSRSPGDGGFGRGRNLEEAYSAYVCVLKVVFVADPLENSYINVTLLVEQSSV